MKTPTKIAVMAVAAMLTFGTSTYAAEPQAGKPNLDNVPAGGAPTPDPRPVMKEKSMQGELIKIDGAFWVIKDAAGQEIRLHVDKNTTKLDKDRAKMERDFQVGDKIEVQLNPNGHASSIQMAMATAPAGEKTLSSEDLARGNLEEQQRFQAKAKEDPGTYPPDFKPEIGGQQKNAPGDFPKPAFPLIQGELMQIEGEFYTLQDLEGKQIRLHVDKNTKLDCGSDSKGTCNFAIGDKIEARRVTPTDPHASDLRKLSPAEIAAMSKVVSPVGAATSDRVKDQQVTLGGAKQALRGEVLKVQGEQFLIKDHHGSEVAFVVNQNTRMLCSSDTSAFSGMFPEPSASDKPSTKGQPQDQTRTNEQPGTDVGPGTKSSAGGKSECSFKAGDKIEAEISDMGAATFIKMAGRAQPGQPLP
jgi:hypothetical protein